MELSNFFILDFMVHMGKEVEDLLKPNMWWKSINKENVWTCLTPSYHCILQYSAVQNICKGLLIRVMKTCKYRPCCRRKYTTFLQIVGHLKFPPVHWEWHCLASVLITFSFAISNTFTELKSHFLLTSADVTKHLYLLPTASVKLK